MNPDDEICRCYHVSLRKLANYARRHKLSRPSQLSECLGAGTGCGWCIPFLKRLFEVGAQGKPEDLTFDMTPEQYAEQRQAYIESKGPRNRF